MIDQVQCCVDACVTDVDLDVAKEFIVERIPYFMQLHARFSFLCQDQDFLVHECLQDEGACVLIPSGHARSGKYNRCQFLQCAEEVSKSF